MPARAPGKIIISGEHAVVYGRPALAMAVNCYVEARVESAEQTAIEIQIGDRPVDRFSLMALGRLKQRMDEAYASFAKGEAGIEKVVPDPEALIAYGIAALAEETAYSIQLGFNLAVTSEIPPGCGMGSSAAVLLAVLYEVARNWGLSRDNRVFQALVTRTENLQHGTASGVDSQVCLHGGFIRYQDGLATPLDPPSHSWALALTGVPDCSTGQCVEAVAAAFRSSAIWDQFESVTEFMQSALAHADRAGVRQGIQKNHELLCQIGVVPQPVQHFIEQVERQGGAAKICGAGAVTGPRAGVVLIDMDQNPAPLCEEFAYPLIPIAVDTDGTRLV